MKIEIVYLSSDTKSLMYYNVKYKYRETIQKYYFKIRQGSRILIIERKLYSKTTTISIYYDNFTYTI